MCSPIKEMQKYKAFQCKHIAGCFRPGGGAFETRVSTFFLFLCCSVALSIFSLLFIHSKEKSMCMCVRVSGSFFLLCWLQNHHICIFSTQRMSVCECAFVGILMLPLLFVAPMLPPNARHWGDHLRHWRRSKRISVSHRMCTEC